MNIWATLRGDFSARIFLTVALVLFLTFLFPTGATIDYDYQPGSVWNYEDVIARFAFPIYRDPALYEQEKSEAIRNTIPSFYRVDTLAPTLLNNSARYISHLVYLINARIDAGKGIITESQWQKIHDSLKQTLPQKLAEIEITSMDWMKLISLRETGLKKKGAGLTLSKLHRFIDQQMTAALKIGFLDQAKSSFVRPTLALHEGKQERIRPLANFIDREELEARIKAQFLSAFPSYDSLLQTTQTIFFGIIRPNIIYDHERTQIAIDWNIDRVPRTIGIVKENERIVSKHDRVAEEIKAKLDSYRKAKVERGGTVNLWLQAVGKAGHVTLVLFLLAIYLYQFRKKIFYDNSRLLAISFLIIFECFLSFITFNLTTSQPLEYLILVPTASMLLTIMFDSRVGYNGTVVIAFLVSAIRGNDYSILLTSLVGGALSVYTVRDIKYRTQIFRSLAFIFLGYAFTIIILGLQRFEEFHVLSNEVLFALGNAVLSPVFTFGFLVFFERVFGITTDLTLLELSDFNHPLLRDLSTRAPGTFHHSIVMGTLAEAAAQAIGANPILARVGAYYHDVGKKMEPEYFVENQMGGSNIHEDLSPLDSSKHIINHVVHGIELAKQYKLPQRIIDFIPAHHGKTMVSYFYEKEKRQNPDAEIGDFRYPGPKPQTKETGIVMLADTIEAAARAIEDPTIDKIEKLIDDVVKKRLSNGQLDNCDLTLRDLQAIKKSFLGILTGIHHSRIQYPDAEQEEAARKLAERTQKLLSLPSAVEALSRRIKKINIQ